MSGWRWASGVVSMLAGCGGGAPAISLGYGTLAEDHVAAIAWGCSPEQRMESVHQESTALSPSQRSVSRRLTSGVALATFEFDVDVAPAAERSAALTLTANARAEDNRCGTGCEGAAAITSFTWTGAVVLPPAPEGYAVRVRVQAGRTTSRGEGRYSGECAVETPWRPPIVVESGDSTRDFEAPAGEATVRVVCERTPSLSFAQLSCFGAPTSAPPESQGLDGWVSASLRVRFEFVAR